MAGVAKTCTAPKGASAPIMRQRMIRANREARHLLHAGPFATPSRIEALWCRFQEIYSIGTKTEHLVEFEKAEVRGKVVDVTSLSTPTKKGAQWRVTVDMEECSRHATRVPHCRDPPWVVLRRALFSAMAYLIACYESETAHQVARTVFSSSFEAELVAFTEEGREREEGGDGWAWALVTSPCPIATPRPPSPPSFQEQERPTGAPVGTWHPFLPQSTMWGALQWRRNSCYIDTLLMIMFTSDARSVFTPVIKAPNGGDAPVPHRHVRSALNGVRRRLHRGEWFDCMDLRTALLPFAPETQSVRTGAWQAYETENVYSVFTDVFPSLKTQYTQVTRSKVGARTGAGEGGESTTSRRSVAFFQVWDFMEDPRSTATGPVYAEIQWDALTSPLLVFHNGGIPPIAHFHTTGREELGSISLGGGHVVEDAGTVYKVRALAPTILGGAYELVGVVMLTGAARGRGGHTSGHYTAYLRATSPLSGTGGWFHYDDTRADLQPPCIRVGAPHTVPHAVWHDWNRRKPVLWFYRRREEGAGAGAAAGASAGTGAGVGVGVVGAGVGVGVSRK